MTFQHSARVHDGRRFVQWLAVKCITYLSEDEQILLLPAKYELAYCLRASQVIPLSGQHHNRYMRL